MHKTRAWIGPPSGVFKIFNRRSSNNFCYGSEITIVKKSIYNLTLSHDVIINLMITWRINQHKSKRRPPTGHGPYSSTSGTLQQEFEQLFITYRVLFRGRQGDP